MKKYITRNLLSPLISLLGIDRVVSEVMRSRDYLILTFHGVVPDNTPRINFRHMGVTQFREMVKHLKSRYEILPLQTLVEMQAAGIRPKRKSIALTFDDGYENLFHHALPILKAEKVHISIFPLVGQMINPEWIMWADAMDLILADKEKGTVRLNGDFFHKQEGIFIREGHRETIHEFVKQLGDERDWKIQRFQEDYKLENCRVQSNPDLWRLLSPDQIRVMHETGLVEIGSHGVFHGNMSKLNDAMLIDELHKSKYLLEEIIQAEVKSLAYPNGDFSALSNQVAFKAGYSYLFAATMTAKLFPEAPLQALPRFSVSNSTTNYVNLIKIELGFTPLIK